MEWDGCPFSSPPGMDGQLNPGEDVEFGLWVRSRSEGMEHHAVTGKVDALTPAVHPTSVTVDFGTVAPGEVVRHTGDPILLSLPLSISCGDVLYFRISFSSLEGGEFSPEIISVPVNGDPVNCHCTPVELYYESCALEDDRCLYESPPGGDGLVNPGEDVDLRIGVRNASDSKDLTFVAGVVEALTPDVTPTTALLDFGAVPAGESAGQEGDPLTVSLPLSVTCGNELLFLITLSSAETGELPLQFFTVPVDGDPAKCECDDPLQVWLHRGTVPSLGPGWQAFSLPLSSGNDDETPLLPARVSLPDAFTDDSVPGAPLVLYRLLRRGDVSVEDTDLRMVKTSGAVNLHF
jgi:hypothetical protein